MSSTDAGTGDRDLASRVQQRIRVVPDFPQPGIAFQDITPVLADAALFGDLVVGMAEPHRGRVDVVAGIEARGFILATPIAVELGVGFVPMRKRGKLPHTTVVEAYDLEYGQAEIELHTDAVGAGQRVLLIDDVLATGGTAAAACALLERLGAEVTSVALLLEIAALDGRSRLPGRDVRTLLSS